MTSARWTALKPPIESSPIVASIMFNIMSNLTLCVIIPFIAVRENPGTTLFRQRTEKKNPLFFWHS